MPDFATIDVRLWGHRTPESTSPQCNMGIHTLSLISCNASHRKWRTNVTNIRISAHFTQLRKFRNFVFATEVTIFSNNNPLMYLRECSPKSAKLTRWTLGLQEFMHADSNIFHTPVEDNTICPQQSVIFVSTKTNTPLTCGSTETGNRQMYESC